MILENFIFIRYDDLVSISIVTIAPMMFILFWRLHCKNESSSADESAKACAWFEAMSEQMKSQRLPRSAALITFRAMSNE